MLTRPSDARSLRNESAEYESSRQIASPFIRLPDVGQLSMPRPKRRADVEPERRHRPRSVRRSIRARPKRVPWTDVGRSIMVATRSAHRWSRKLRAIRERRRRSLRAGPVDETRPARAEAGVEFRDDRRGSRAPPPARKGRRASVVVAATCVERVGHRKSRRQPSPIDLEVADAVTPERFAPIECAASEEIRRALCHVTPIRGPSKRLWFTPPHQRRHRSACRDQLRYCRSARRFSPPRPVRAEQRHVTIGPRARLRRRIGQPAACKESESDLPFERTTIRCAEPVRAFGRHAKILERGRGAQLVFAFQVSTIDVIEACGGLVEIGRYSRRRWR